MSGSSKNKSKEGKVPSSKGFDDFMEAISDIGVDDDKPTEKSKFKESQLVLPFL